jgi:hypothetical protein
MGVNENDVRGVTASNGGLLFIGNHNNSPSNGDIIFGSNGGSDNFTENMRITKAGDVGIKTSSPSHPLDVDDSNGNALIDVREGDTAVFYNGIDAGPIQAAEDTYQQLIDQNITSGLSAGDQVGYTFAVDNTTVMQVSAEADGSGGIQRAKPKFEDVANMTVQSSTPSNPEEGDIYIDDGSNTSSGNYAVRIYNGTSWVDQN